MSIAVKSQADSDLKVWVDGWLASEDAERDKISVKRVYIDINDGNLYDALIFSQIMYWHGRNKETGTPRLRVYRDGHFWLAKTYDDWWEECRVAARQAKASIARIEKRGLITKKLYKFNGVPTVHVRVDWDAFAFAIRHQMSNPMDTECPIRSTLDVHSYTETTSKDYFFNQGINQSDKAVPGTADRDAEFDRNDSPQEEISIAADGKNGSDSYAAESNQKAAPTTGLGNSNKNNDYAAFSPKKEKTSKGKQRKVAFKYDAYGVIQMPEAKRYKLPSILTMRTMQFLLAKELECEFGIDKDGDIWIADPKMGDWMLEDEMFGGGSDREQGQLPLKKMVSILNFERATFPLDIDWYNETAKRSFEFWRSNCDRLGKDALPTIQRYGSIAHWLIKLQDEAFDIEFESIDLEEVA